MIFLASIRWQDVVDILLNSYILFRLYILFRGTNAFRILIGITILWFSQKLAVSLGLVLTSWVIQAVTAVAALIIIVVFRHEIRSILQTRNLKAILWGYPHRTISTPVHVIVESVFDLSGQGIGALIVIPGRDDLHDIVHSGIALNGLMSKEILTGIFWPDNPVHDGAAVIMGDRIEEVGSILPVSQRGDLASFYGTRHRAAAGLAEITDALVIVVSEERKSITIARGNRLQKISSKKELEKKILSHVEADASEKAHLPREKVELGLAALVCFCFITAIWFGFTRGEDTLITLEVPIEYMNRDPRFEYLDTEVNTVLIQLSGAEALLKSVQPGQIKAKIDLGSGKPGLNTFPIRPEHITIPPGVLLKKVSPAAVNATLDRAVSKELPVQVDWTGRMPEGYRIESVRITPSAATVVCKSRLSGQLATIYTGKIPVDTLRESGKKTVGLAQPADSANITIPEDCRVLVEYIVTASRHDSTGP